MSYENYEVDLTDIYGFARHVGADVREKGDELQFKLCPYCHGQGKNSVDKNTFSINIHTGQFKCFRDGCGTQGNLKKLCDDFGYKAERSGYRSTNSNYKAKKTADTKQYVLPPQQEITSTDYAVKYMAEQRGISEATTRRYHITTLANRPDILVFPFMDENGTTQFIKYRDANYFKGKKWSNGKDANKEWCMANTKPILFGMAQCVDFTTLVVTEGQLDSLALADAGVKNAVSVPTGAKGMNWTQHCYDWVNQFEEIIIMGDCENGHITLVKEFNVKFEGKKIKCVPIECYLGYKDANDIYRRFGSLALRNAIEHAEIVEVTAVKRLKDVANVDVSNLEHVITGISMIDRTIGGLYFGQVILLTGKRGDGKSTFMSQLGCEALNQGYNCFFYSGELTDFHFKNWMVTQLAGSRHLACLQSSPDDYYYKVPDDVCSKIDNWFGDRAFIYDNNYVSDELPDLETTIINVICRYDVRFICLDNLMTAIECSSTSELYRRQSEFVRKLKVIAGKYNVCIVLVAHPRKESGNERREFSNDDISGSADITNRVDTVMVYSRAKATQDCPNPDWDSVLTITKNRLTGRLITSKNPIKLRYSPASRRIMQLGDNINKAYGWEQDVPQTVEENPPF